MIHHIRIAGSRCRLTRAMQLTPTELCSKRTFVHLLHNSGHQNLSSNLLPQICRQVPAQLIAGVRRRKTYARERERGRQEMRELQVPDGVEGDELATEMVRFWLAHGAPHLSLFLGMYQDAEDSDVDELWAWGNILSDIAQHVANGLSQSHDFEFDETVERIAGHFFTAMKQRAPGLTGKYVEEGSIAREH